jgi:hypothetical protein
MNDTENNEPVPEDEEPTSDSGDPPEEPSDELADSDPPIIVQGGG